MYRRAEVSIRVTGGFFVLFKRSAPVPPAEHYLIVSTGSPDPMSPPRVLFKELQRAQPHNNMRLSPARARPSPD